MPETALIARNAKQAATIIRVSEDEEADNWGLFSPQLLRRHAVPVLSTAGTCYRRTSNSKVGWIPAARTMNERRRGGVPSALSRS